MNHYQMTQAQLAKKSGVAQKTVSNILNFEATTRSLTMENADKIARAFGLQLWHLCIPDLPLELMTDDTLERVIEKCRHTAHLEQ
jgi:transcriptional regulator with XRE-family HTH domain